MEINKRALALAAGAITILLCAGVQADDTDDVRRAVMGHEAFIQRCMQDHIDDLADKTDTDLSAMPEAVMELAMGNARTVCENFYKQLNVCVAGGSARGILRAREVMAKIEKVLTDPLTRAQDYDSYSKLMETSERELAALHDLKDGRSDHCDVASVLE